MINEMKMVIFEIFENFLVKFTPYDYRYYTF